MTTTATTGPTDVTTDRPLAVVTGASSGIGLELARRLADDGYDLILAAEDAGIEAAATDVRGRGAAAHPVQTDLATYDGVELLVTSLEAAGRPLDAVCVNAGIGVGGPFVETDLDDKRRLIALNITSAVHLVKRVLPGMVERGAGGLLFTSSVAATMPGPFEAVYAASKAFLQSFADALREETKDTGVHVTTILPGPTATNFFHRAGMDDTRAGQGPQDDAAQVADQAVDALRSGRDKVGGGNAGNKVMAAANRLVPDAVKAKAHRRLSEPGTGD